MVLCVIVVVVVLGSGGGGGWSHATGGEEVGAVSLQRRQSCGMRIAGA
jgi:hypothetical protein